MVVLVVDCHVDFDVDNVQCGEIIFFLRGIAFYKDTHYYMQYSDSYI